MVTLTVVVMTATAFAFPGSDGPIRTTHEIPHESMEKCLAISDATWAARFDYQDRTGKTVISTECYSEERIDGVLPVL